MTEEEIEIHAASLAKINDPELVKMCLQIIVSSVRLEVQGERTTKSINRWLASVGSEERVA